MKIDLSVSTWSFMNHDAYADPRRAVTAIQDMGHPVELWQSWAPAPESFDRGHWGAWKAVLNPCSALSFHTRNNRGRMVEEIEFLAYLGGRILVLHPCVLGLPEDREGEPDLAGSIIQG